MKKRIALLFLIFCLIFSFSKAEEGIVIYKYNTPDVLIHYCLDPLKELSYTSGRYRILIQNNEGKYKWLTVSKIEYLLIEIGEHIKIDFPE